MEPRDETLRLLSDLVAFPTVTSDSNLDLIAYAGSLLSDLGAELTTTYDPARRKANLFATIGPMVDGGVVLSGHTDVVPPGDEGWTNPPFEATRRDGRVYGRGTVDMKGFIACCLAMAPRFAAADLRAPVHLALTYDEEVGCRGAPVMLRELTRSGPKPRAAIVGEPTELRVVVAHKGCYEYTTTFSGLEGHGSAPAKGVNAVEYAARFVARLLELRDELAADPPADSPFDPPSTTINVGVVQGGAARNVIAGSCTVEWEYRPVRRGDVDRVRTVVGDLESRLLAEMREVDDAASIETVSAGEVDGLEDEDDSAAVALTRLLLDDPRLETVSFGTEAGLFQQAGIPAVVCGPGSIDAAHQPDEYVSLDQLDRCLTMLDRLLGHLASA